MGGLDPTGHGLAVEGLCVHYGGFAAVQDLGFSVPAGASLGLVGASGSGKSTVLRAVCGLAPMRAGSVRLLAPPGAVAQAAHGAAAAGAALPPTPQPGSPAWRRRVQMVFQDPYGSLHPRQTVDRALAEPLAIHRMGDATARIAQAMADVGLDAGLRFRYPHQLSGGQRQRVAIARALILQPDVLLLDEPTSALDASVQAEVLNLLHELRTRRGLTYVLVSHDLAVVAHLCEQVLVMAEGRVVERLHRDDLRSRRVQAAATRQLMAAAEGFRRLPSLAPAPDETPLPATPDP